MTLPSSFQKAEEYFEENILVKDVLSHIDITNIDNIFQADFNLEVEAKNNKFLRGFFEKLNRLTVTYDFVEDEEIEARIEAPLSPKKKHEIVYLAKEINELCSNTNCEVVVDFGSGLGYLDQLLFETTNLKVLGLECNDSHYVGAKKRQRKYHIESTETVKYVKHTVTEQSIENIHEYLIDKFPNNNRFCITGLHSCADLTVTALNIFLKMADAKALILMPCCYHKMALNGTEFKNFPLSQCLKDIFEVHKGFEYLKVPFLRLAAQPGGFEDDLNDLVFNLLSRAVLQLYAHNNNCTLKRNKRKAVRMKTMDRDFESYIQDAALNGFKLTNNNSESNETEISFDLQELRTIWREISENLTFKKAAIFVLLQNLLQPVIENFVLFDRLMYLKEHGLEKCYYKCIVNKKISPRCLALVASK